MSTNSQPIKTGSILVLFFNPILMFFFSSFCFNLPQRPWNVLSGNVQFPAVRIRKRHIPTTGVPSGQINLQHFAQLLRVCERVSTLMVVVAPISKHKNINSLVVPQGASWGVAHGDSARGTQQQIICSRKRMMTVELGNSLKRWALSSMK